ncbi:hypothetical protein B0H11DRAFT_2418266 [Mycena galericulata]|nr:hypothetical protein B0H11DRAFT_2418266 [Mycena galericulata]
MTQEVESTAISTELTDVLIRIAILLEKQRSDQAVKDDIQTYSGLSVVTLIWRDQATFITSLSVSFLSYAASLGQSGLNGNALFVVNYIWFITTGGSLFIAGCTGIVAVATGLGLPRHSWRGSTKYRRYGFIFIAIGLFTMLFAMTVGTFVLSNSMMVDAPTGNVHLPAAVIYPLVGVAVLVMVFLSVFMLCGARPNEESTSRRVANINWIEDTHLYLRDERGCRRRWKRGIRTFRWSPTLVSGNKCEVDAEGINGFRESNSSTVQARRGTDDTEIGREE